MKAVQFLIVDLTKEFKASKTSGVRDNEAIVYPRILNYYGDLGWGHPTTICLNPLRILLTREYGNAKSDPVVQPIPVDEEVEEEDEDEEDNEGNEEQDETSTRAAAKAAVARRRSKK